MPLHVCCMGCHGGGARSADGMRHPVPCIAPPPCSPRHQCHTPSQALKVDPSKDVPEFVQRLQPAAAGQAEERVCVRFWGPSVTQVRQPGLPHQYQQQTQHGWGSLGSLRAPMYPAQRPVAQLQCWEPLGAHGALC